MNMLELSYDFKILFNFWGFGVLIGLNKSTRAKACGLLQPVLKQYLDHYCLQDEVLILMKRFLEDNPKERTTSTACISSPNKYTNISIVQHTAIILASSSRIISE